MSLPPQVNLVNALAVLGGLSSLCMVAGPVLEKLGLQKAAHVCLAIGMDVRKVVAVLSGLQAPALQAAPPPRPEV